MIWNMLDGSVKIETDNAFTLTENVSDWGYLEGCSNYNKKIDLVSILCEGTIKLVV